MNKFMPLFISLALTSLVFAQADTSRSTATVAEKQTGNSTETVRAPDSTGTVDTVDSVSIAEEKAPPSSTSNIAQEESKELVAEDTVIRVSDSAMATLKVMTVPDSATVVFDGTALGKTPFTIPDIAAGKHVLLLKKKGYFAKKATVNITAGSQSELTFELVKPVLIAITSEPAGAAVIVNNNNVGTTPYVDSTLKPDTYTISLGLEGYLKEQHTVRLGSGERDSLSVVLKPIEKRADKTVVVGQKEKIPEKDRKVSSILDKVALAVFLGFSLIILLIELTQDK